jgi:hypothetical protein
MQETFFSPAVLVDLLGKVLKPLTDIMEHDLERFKGVFCWDEALLKQRIKIHHPHYDEDDPRTWPLILRNHIEDATGKKYDGSDGPLPTRVAYTTGVFLAFAQKHNDELQRDEQLIPGNPYPRVTSFWVKYPFNTYWHMRKAYPDGPTLSQGEQRLWHCFVEYRHAINSQKAANSTAESDTDAIDPDTAYAQIVRAMSERQGSSTTTAQLNANLKSVQAQLTEKTQKVEAADTKATSLQTELDALRKAHRKELQRMQHDVRSLQGQLDQSKTINETSREFYDERIQKAVTKMQGFRQQISKDKKDLEVSQKEVTELKQRIVNIWTMMQHNDDSNQLANSTPSKREADAALDPTSGTEEDASKRTKHRA